MNKTETKDVNKMRLIDSAKKETAATVKGLGHSMYATYDSDGTCLPF